MTLPLPPLPQRQASTISGNGNGRKLFQLLQEKIIAHPACLHHYRTSGPRIDQHALVSGVET